MKRSLSVAVSLAVSGLVTVSGCAHAPAPASPKAPIASVAAPVLPFIEDDYPRALAEARATNRPIFVDGWAPW